MTDEDRYYAAAHRVQTAIAYGVASKAMEPKHLRTGIDMSKAEMAGLATLLIAKGVFTLEEYTEAMANAVEHEADRMEAELSRRLGANVRTR